MYESYLLLVDKCILGIKKLSFLVFFIEIDDKKKKIKIKNKILQKLRIFL